jgi:hypothetical protein
MINLREIIKLNGISKMLLNREAHVSINQLIRLFLREGLVFSKAIKNIPNRPPR